MAIALEPDDFFNKEEEERIIKRNEASKKLKELKAKKDVILQEESKLRDIIKKIDEKTKEETRQKYVGKCFEANTEEWVALKLKGIKAFKILNLLPAPHNHRVLAVCITQNDTNDSFEDLYYGVRQMVLSPWQPLDLRLMQHENDPLLISASHEIPESEFNRMFGDQISRLIDATNASEK